MEGTSKAIAQLHINGEIRDTVIRSGDTLLHTLRNELGLSGAKRACENGDCGACTVLVNDEPMHSCLTLSIENTDKMITTIEGLIDSPIQKAFVENWAIQCGFCTPGFIMNCQGLINNHPDPDDATIEEWMQSNLCRCTGYAEIKAAIKAAIQESKKQNGKVI
ncbi:(2Fe-2S)-binding protein [Lederbergia panacisoli]|uniref:(2Fe-2S)-binding protein n=1 Tax=Lederbergia panacisoli TaxID=1255251 RepID=UPI00214C63BA|nr:(2Fe-2S)-binding protein [Lederbergia panacisoli]MCR2821594.1 (2Fe-2S)-binding protein [Lederbergia panacisoli]